MCAGRRPAPGQRSLRPRRPRETNCYRQAAEDRGAETCLIAFPGPQSPSLVAVGFGPGPGGEACALSPRMADSGDAGGSIRDAEAGADFRPRRERGRGEVRNRSPGALPWAAGALPSLHGLCLRAAGQGAREAVRAPGPPLRRALWTLVLPDSDRGFSEVQDSQTVLSKAVLLRARVCPRGAGKAARRPPAGGLGPGRGGLRGRHYPVVIRLGHVGAG